MSTAVRADGGQTVDSPCTWGVCSATDWEAWQRKAFQWFGALAQQRDAGLLIPPDKRPPELTELMVAATVLRVEYLAWSKVVEGGLSNAARRDVGWGPDVWKREVQALASYTQRAADLARALSAAIDAAGGKSPGILPDLGSPKRLWPWLVGLTVLLGGGASGFWWWRRHQAEQARAGQRALGEQLLSNYERTSSSSRKRELEERMRDLYLETDDYELADRLRASWK